MTNNNNIASMNFKRKLRLKEAFFFVAQHLEDIDPVDWKKN